MKRKVNLPDVLSEAAILKQILEYLERRGVFAWRNNSGGALVKGNSGKGYFMRFGMPGSSDILAIIPKDYCNHFESGHTRVMVGQFWAIEVKKRGGKLSPAQEAFRDAVLANGGKYTLARSLDDVIEAMK